MLFAAPHLTSIGNFATPVPAGVIVGYEGSIASLADFPAWALCDGSNGTPDLRDRFIMGAGDGVPVGSTGGAKTGQLTGASTTEGAHGYIGGGGGTSGGGGYKWGIGGEHAHTVVGDLDWLPPSRQVVYIRASIPAKVPPQAVAWSYTAPAGGWIKATDHAGHMMVGRGDDLRGTVGSSTRTLKNISVLTSGIHAHPQVGGYSTGGTEHSNGGGGDHTHTAPADIVLANVSPPPFLALFVIRTDSENGGRKGVVMAYAGTLAALPPEWAVCDGTGGTPVLTGKIPMGADDVTIGTIGGSSAGIPVAGSALASSTVNHHHNSGGAVLSGGGDHSTYAWTHAHAGWSGTVNPMPPWHALYFITWKG